MTFHKMEEILMSLMTFYKMEGSVYNKTQEYEKKSMLLKTCHIVEENIIEDSAQCQINLCHGTVTSDTQYDAIN